MADSNNNSKPKDDQPIFRLADLELSDPTGNPLSALADAESDATIDISDAIEAELPTTDPSDPATDNNSDFDLKARDTAFSGAKINLRAADDEPAFIAKDDANNSLPISRSESSFSASSHDIESPIHRSISQSQHPQAVQSMWPKLIKDNPKPRPTVLVPSDSRFRLAQSDPYLGRRRNIMRVVLLILVAALCFAVWQDPEILTRAKTSLTELTDSFKSKYAKTRKIGKSAKATTPVLDSSLQRAVESGECEAIIHASLRQAANQQLAVKQRNRIIDCFLSSDSLTDAETFLKPLRPQLQKASEKTINDLSNESMLAEGLLLTASAYLRMGRFNEAEKLVEQRCQNFSLTSTCIARLLVSTAIANFTKNRTRNATLLPTQDTSSPLLQSYLSYIKGQLAITGRQTTVSDAQFSRVIQSAPKANLSLVRDAYLAWSIDLYHRRDTASLSKVIKMAQQESPHLEKAIAWKLLLLRELADPQKSQVALQRFFGRPNFVYRAKRDFQFAQAIGADAIRSGYGAQYRQLLSEQITELRNGLRADSATIAILSLWRIRTLLAQGRYDDLLRESSEHERLAGKSNVISHFRGVTLMNSNQNPNSQLLAAREFKTAIDLRATWQSYYGLTTALVRSGDLNQSQAALKLFDLQQRNVPAARPWFELARAEWFIAAGKAQEALAIIVPIQQQHPSMALAWELQASALRKLIKRTEADAAEAAAQQLTTKFGLHGDGSTEPHPLSSLALMD